VQIADGSRRASRDIERDIEHVGSAHDDAEFTALKAAAEQRRRQAQGGLDRGLDVADVSGPLEIVSSRMGHFWAALCRGYDTFGFTDGADGDEVFRDRCWRGS
jgi:hypothetical protein